MRDFFRPVATLLTGTVLAQVVVYASRPLLTRLYTPEDYGVLSFFAGFVAVISSMSGGKFDDALMLPRDPARAWALAAMSILLSICTAFAVALLTPFRNSLLPLLSSPAAVDILWLAPFSIMFVGIARTSDAWLTRLSRFDVVARGRVAHSLSTVPSQIAGGLSRLGPTGLVGGLLLGQAVQSVYYGLSARVAATSAALSRPKFSEMVDAARRYRRFALFGAPGTALNTASVQLPALLLLFFFDASVLGNYGVGYSVLAVPMALLGSAVAQVYYVRAAEAIREDRLQNLTEGVFRRLVAIGLFPILCIAIAGPPIFRIVFGSSWTSAGLYAAYLAPWVYLVFVSSPLSRLFDLLEKQRELLVFNVVLFVVRAGALVAGGLTGRADMAILLFGVAGAAMWLFHTVWTLRLSGLKGSLAVSVVGRFLLIALPPAAIVLAATIFGTDLIATVGSVVGAGIYFFLVYRIEPRLLSEVSVDPPNERAN